jgi:hypothetical protein
MRSLAIFLQFIDFLFLQGVASTSSSGFQPRVRVYLTLLEFQEANDSYLKQNGALPARVTHASAKRSALATATPPDTINPPLILSTGSSACPSPSGKIPFVLLPPPTHSHQDQMPKMQRTVLAPHRPTRRPAPRCIYSLQASIYDEDQGFNKRYQKLVKTQREAGGH